MGIYKKVFDDAVSTSSESICKILCDYYLENEVSDSMEVHELFDKLDLLLSELTLKNYDRIWDTSVKLCGLHERRGFDAGFRMGMNLARELQEPEQGRDS